MRRPLLLALLALCVASAASADVLRIVVNDMIHPITEEYIGRAIDEATKTKADALVIELRTPGGLDDSTRAIVEKIFASSVPVVVYVTPSGARAASAGFFILESADIAAMAPGTNTGAAHPVVIGAEKIDDIMKMKMQNDAAAFMRTIAQRRGRNVPVAESGVREAKSFTEDEAKAQKLIDVVAVDLPSLLKEINGREIKRFNGQTARLKTDGAVKTFEMSLRQRLLSWIMNPNIAFILFSLGMLAIWAEFNHPGAILPGVVGVIAILLAVFALNLLPTRYAALALLALAFILFALEAKYTSYGILGIGGVLCMVFGALLLVDGPIPEMRVNLITALVVSVPIGVIAVFLMTLVLRAHKERVMTGVEAMLGEIGVARTALAPEGKVFVHGELWNAVAPTPVEEGARVRVKSVDGLKLTVEPQS
jgi:membrane-bound serine protease (ClpP class)